MTAICVSLTEATTEATLARMAALAPRADLFEIRADFLGDLDLPALLRARSKPLLFTCRPESEGGRWPDSDPEGRRRRLREAAESEIDLVDVELRAGFDDVVAARAGRGLVVSFHDLAGVPGDLEELRAEMAGLGADVVKIVGTPRSVTDLGRLMAFARGHSAGGGGRWRGLVALAMGPLGVASRILGGRHGAPFTYAAPVEGREAAPGQLPAETLADGYRVRSIGAETRVYGILGVDILRSLSPAIHNRAFAERGLDAVYVPLQAESLPAFLEALPDLGLSGFSVTRPWKSDILPYLASDHVEPSAGKAGSVNTVVVRDGRLVGSSTDGDGVLGPLRHHLVVTDRSVTIVGAGGAARAAALALVGVGARVRVLARRPQQSAAVGADVGCAHGPLDALSDEPWDVLINATPVGSGARPGEMPIPEASLRPGTVVFDMVYEPRETPLLRAARSAGCRTIDGVEMLVAQAVGQFEAWTGVPAPVEAMTEAALGALAGEPR
ncbi:MAG: shikimate dehydrogenase [Acidobacteria bacterium]|nr:shikimate dehydrogenase [Acidobacteriota bacterium]